MHKLLLILTFILLTHFNGFGQINMKSEAQILKGIEWLTNNPVEETDSLFLGYVLDNGLYQMSNYPNFPMKFEALTEFMQHDTKYNYLVEINMVFYANMLAQKIETGDKFNLQEASFQSMKKVVNYYQLLIAMHPDETNKVLDAYCALNEEEMRSKLGD